MRTRLVYVGHPVSGNVEANLDGAARAVRWVALNAADAVPVAPYIGYCRAFDDGRPEERELGMALDSVVLASCDEVWFFGDAWTEGMLRERREAEALRLPVRDLVGERMPGDLRP